MARILRGEIYWADLNPTMGKEQSGLRPVLVLSQVRTLSTERLTGKLGKASPIEIEQVVEGLKELVGA